MQGFALVALLVLKRPLRCLLEMARVHKTTLCLGANELPTRTHCQQ